MQNKRYCENMITKLPFRQNYWSHICFGGKVVWKDLAYKFCDACKVRNTNIKIRKGSHPI